MKRSVFNLPPAAWSSPRSSWKAAGEAASFMGEEIWSSPDGTFTVMLFWRMHVAAGRRESNLSLFSSIAVWCRGAVRREERRSDRQDVRLSPGSFLQLFPAEVLMSLAGCECSDMRRRGEKNCQFTVIFYDTVEERVLPNPYEKRTIVVLMISIYILILYNGNTICLCKEVMVMEMRIPCRTVKFL